MSVKYPLFVFGKDDKSVRLIEKESRILHKLEAIDIENDEYVFWDANGLGVIVAVAPSSAFRQGRLESVTLAPAVFPILDAFKLFAKSIGYPEAVSDGEPMDVWRSIQAGMEHSPKKRC